MLIFPIIRPPPSSPLFPYTTLFRSAMTATAPVRIALIGTRGYGKTHLQNLERLTAAGLAELIGVVDIAEPLDRKSTRLNSSHVAISYAVFCLKKKKRHQRTHTRTRN